VAGRRVYGQYCGLARAVEIVGERWALLIIRDLLVGPRRFTDLRRGLPRIPTNVLTERLRELEDAGVVERRVLPRPAGGSVVYALTPYGAELEDVVLRLGLWGAQALGEPRPGEIVTLDSLIIALRTTFRPAAARDRRLSFELRLDDVVLHAAVDAGTVRVGPGELEGADLVIETGPGLKALLAGELSPGDALASGAVRVLRGNPALLDAFAELFQIPS
jgi:DNA-binding HxlR family transcriptional regulator